MHRKTYDELQFTDDFLFCHILMETDKMIRSAKQTESAQSKD